MSRELLGDRAIGMLNVKLSAFCVNGGGESTYQIWYGQEIVGDLTFITKYTPSVTQEICFGDKNES